MDSTSKKVAETLSLSRLGDLTPGWKCHFGFTEVPV